MSSNAYISISELHPNFSHPKVVGIIIGKTDVRSFPDRKNFSVDRFTFGFTVRDSPDFFINVTSWGNDAYIHRLSSSFTVGDCVTIENPLVSNKDPEKGDRFCPATPSLYRLQVSEAHSQVLLCPDVDLVDRMLPLLHLPVKHSADFYSLADIVANGQSLSSSVINVLAAVRSIGETKFFTTSDGRKGQRLELKLFDDSVSSFPLVCWDREAIQLVQTVVPKETVLFIADAKISFDSFRKSMTASVNSRTVITINPDTREASLLFSYAKHRAQSGALDQDLDQDQDQDLPVESITDVYTVNQLKLKAEDHPDVFYGITYSFISKLDIDSSVSKVIKTRCSRCRFQVCEDSMSCSNQLCPSRDQIFSATTGFDLLVEFSDHTGTMKPCSLRSPEADRMLGCSTEEFSCLTDDQRTEMKWKFLLERCKIYVKINPSTKTRTRILGSVLSCSLADPGEVTQNMAALLQRT